MGLHGGYLLGAEHGGWVLEGGLSWGVLAALTGVFWATCFLLNASGTAYSLGLYVNSLKYMFLGKDTKYKAGAVQGDTGLITEEGKRVEDRTIIFIRHGESTWNQTFNPVGINKLLFPFGLLYALITESYLLLTGRKDSWFYDSPLNMLGQQQAADLRSYLEKESQWPRGTPQAADLKLLKSDPGTPTVLVSSTLRRAVSTVAIALYDRLQATGEKITWLPCCQEISRNPDTLCITPALGPAVPAMTDVGYAQALKQPIDMEFTWSNFMDLSQHTGNKPLGGTGGQRLHAFAKWAFESAFTDNNGVPGSAHPSPCIIVGGHSLWFRSFFREFIPTNATPENCVKAKNKKMMNGGAVAFTLRCVSGEDDHKQYKIVPESVRVVFKGFSK